MKINVLSVSVMSILLFWSICCQAADLNVIIDGVAGQELENVKIALAVPEGIQRDGTVEETRLAWFLKQAPERTKKALEPFGYYSPAVNVSHSSVGSNIHEIHVQVEPGKPVRLTSVKVDLSGPGGKEQQLMSLVQSFPLSPGDILRQDIYESRKRDIIAKAVELGYLDADFSTHLITVEPETFSADIDLVLQTGELYYFGEIRFLGAAEYPESFFSRYLEFKTSDVFSYAKVGLTQRNLVGSNMLDEIVINTDKNAAVNHRVPVEIRLTPSKSKRLRFGIGYETDVGPKLSVRYEHVNVFHTGHVFDSRFDISATRPEANLKYIIPHEKDIRSLSTVSLVMKRDRQTDVFTENITAEVERARSITKIISGSVFLQMLKERSEAGDEKTNTFSVLPGLRVSGVSYDSTIRPRRGFRFAVELKGTHQVLGSDTGLIQLTTEGARMIPLPGKFTLHMRAKIGATILNEPKANLPIALRFFAGGDKSVRGYGYKKLGPKDDKGDVIGGRNLLVGSVELERAIKADWGAAIFYDTGNAFNDFADMRLAQGAGLGVRYYTPIGPVRLDIARQIGVKKPGFRLHLSIGFGL